MDKPASRLGTAVGLKKAVLSGNETLAQSVALIAPTAAPLLTIPLVYASAGSASWFTFVCATLIIFMVALNVNQFAKTSASPGSLYSYIASHMHPAVGILGAWALVIAYIGTGISIAAGLTNYTNVVLKTLFGIQVFPLAIAAAGVAFAVWLAYRDVSLSARLMLGLEVVSVVLISTVAIGVLARHGFRPDMEQLTIQGLTADKLRLSLVLAVFCSVGFESATSLGAEAKDPLTNIPRAVKWSGILAGMFFIFCAYTEVLGFHGETETLDKSLAPMNVLAKNAGMPPAIGLLINMGALVSFFSCFLACITASARVLYLMAQKGALHSLLGRAHALNQTPHRALAVSGAAAFLPLAVLISTGISAFDIYGLLGTLATFGFLTAYILVCVAVLLFLRAEARLGLKQVAISSLALFALGLAFVGSVYPVPPAPYAYLPYIYLALLLGGLIWSSLHSHGSLPDAEEITSSVDAIAEG